MSEIKSIKFEDEVELKKFLANKQFVYGVPGIQSQFIICYRDNRAGTVLARGVFASPIQALRNLNNIVPEVKLPIDEIDVHLELCYDPTQNAKVCKFDDYITLSPYMYFKKKEEKLEEKVEEKTE